MINVMRHDISNNFLYSTGICDVSVNEFDLWDDTDEIVQTAADTNQSVNDFTLILDQLSRHVAADHAIDSGDQHPGDLALTRARHLFSKTQQHYGWLDHLSGRQKWFQKVPRPGIEPGSSAWQADILTTILTRMLTRAGHLFCSRTVCVSRDDTQGISGKSSAALAQLVRAWGC